MTGDKKVEKTKDKKNQKGLSGSKEPKAKDKKTKSEKQNIEEYNSDEETVDQKIKTKENKIYTGWKGIDKGLMLSDLTQKKNVEQLRLFDVVLLKRLGQDRMSFIYPVYYDNDKQILYYTQVSPIESQVVHAITENANKTKVRELFIKKEHIEKIIYLGRLLK